MKKLMFIFSCFFVPALAACTSEEAPVANPQPKQASSNLRTIEEAVEIAKAFVGNQSRSIVEVANVTVIGSSNSRSASDTLIYAINFADNKGYTLVSAAKRGIAVFGYTDEGVYDAEEAAQNPSFNYYLDAAKTYADGGLYGGSILGDSLDLGGLILPPSISIIPTRKVIIPARVGVNYGQRYPEGYYCPNGISGCVQTAMAMAFSYLERPTYINYTCDFDVTSEYFNWSTLSKHKESINTYNTTDVNSHLSTCEASEDTHLVLGRLCRELGYRNYAIYNTNSTGAHSIYARNTSISLLGSSKVSEIKSFKIPYLTLEDDLDEKPCVALMFGYDSSAGGHAWICDGVEDYIYTSTATRWDGTVEEVEEHNAYYHYNWGWNGKDNGYFHSGVFDNTKARSRYDFKDDVHYFIVYK